MSVIFPSNTQNYLKTSLWTQPLLLTRKDIWTFFPVTVVPLGSDANGAECHAIEWHMKNLRSWIKLWNMPRLVAYDHLMAALKSSRKWYVDPPRNGNMLCVIRMRFRAAIPTPVETPFLTCLNDIKHYYPVVWHPVASSTEYPVYSVEIYANLLAKMTKAAGYDVTDKVKKELAIALKASPAWIVLDGVEKQEFCRLQMVPRCQYDAV